MKYAIFHRGTVFRAFPQAFDSYNDALKFSQQYKGIYEVKEILEEFGD